MTMHRRWRKLPLDGYRYEIVASELTPSMAADGAYDGEAVYAAVTRRA
jgi:hypothetical protein